MAYMEAYTWVQTHKELVRYLSNMKDKQGDLISLLESVGVTGFNDRDSQGNTIRLSEMDPFTFFFYIYKYGVVKRLEILQNIASHLGLVKPTDADGIPSTTATNVWIFPYKKDRVNNEIDRLWSFFFKAIEHNITEVDYEDVLEIKGLGKPKLTEALFAVDPEFYLPINAQTKPYLKDYLGINPSFVSFSDYLNLLDKVKQNSSMPMYEFSAEAWKWNTQTNKTNYWLFQANPKIYDIVGALRELTVTRWRVNSFQDIVKIGDKVILWATGEISGCYALGEVTSNIEFASKDIEEQKFYKDDSYNAPQNRVKIRLIHNLVENPILKSDISGIKELENLKAGNQGTNFRATEKQFNAFLKIIKVKAENVRETTSNPPMPDNYGKQNYPLNMILFGPPGTGKTYNTINKAVAISEGISEIDLKSKYKTRTNLKARYKQLVEDGRIVFTTFHQSMSYEDFIEGIKPMPPQDDEPVKYETKAGIFKTLCDKAKQLNTSNIKVDWDNARYFKISLGGVDNPNIHEYCLEKNVISLGWGRNENLSDYYALAQSNEVNNWDKYKEKFKKEFPELSAEERFTIQATFWFQNMKIGDIVVVSKGNRIVDAVGVVDGPYYWDENPEIEYSHFRKVKWIAKNLNLPFDRFLNRQLSQMTIYNLSQNAIKIHAFKELTLPATTKPYVLIIDEINRGNVSQIFGELITLIEEDKRQDEKESLDITLPYSQDKFSVPTNIYIIGTMNTADRSIEALDTALRRRFTFLEMFPEYSVLDDNGTDLMANEVEGMFLRDLLFTLNKRIEALLDRDHQIGHSYFLQVQNISDLKEVFEKKIIPLLQEYFYGDYGKIGLVLGNGFVYKSGFDVGDFSVFDYSDVDSLLHDVYQLKHNLTDDEFKVALKLLNILKYE